MKRCEVLAAVPAALIGCAQSLAAEGSLILALFCRYEDLRAASHAYVYGPADGPDEDAAVERLFWEERDRIEAQMMAIPAATAQDVAAKMLVARCFGDFTCLGYAANRPLAEVQGLAFEILNARWTGTASDESPDDVAANAEADFRRFAADSDDLAAALPVAA